MLIIKCNPAQALAVKTAMAGAAAPVLYVQGGGNVQQVHLGTLGGTLVLVIVDPYPTANFLADFGAATEVAAFVNSDLIAASLGASF